MTLRKKISIKSIIKRIIPKYFLNRFLGYFYGWSGSFSSWSEASAKCTGYDNGVILEKVKNALLKVKNGEAVYERDSVLFFEAHYSYSLLSALDQVGEKFGGHVNILDFGGSLGSTYYQNKSALTPLKSLQWNIVEQSHFVEEGKKNFANETLHFYEDIESCLKENKVNILLLSSVLQYIDRPYELIDSFLKYEMPYILIDRAPVLLIGNDRITIQKVPKKIYKASYPCWLLNENNLISAFESKYILISQDTTRETINVADAAFKTFFFKLR
jgi:putative methyltransferase (TIGR04325 family)